MMAENLLKEWNKVIFGEEPILMKIKYRLNDRDGDSDTSHRPPMQDLKRKREILAKDHGDDPLEESRRIGARAQGLRDRNNEPDEHAADDDDGAAGGGEEIQEERANEENEPLELSGLPPRKKMYVKVYGGVEPDEDVFTPDGRVRKRRPWTDGEIVALQVGVQKFGKGCWADIKQEYAETLRNRTTVQLKDKWRNIERISEDTVEV